MVIVRLVLAGTAPWVTSDAVTEALPDGELGSLCVTELYKTGSPQIRYNTMDLSFLYPRERCRCGSWMPC